MMLDRLKGLAVGVSLYALLSLLYGCKSTRYVPMERVRTEYRDRISTVHDTVRETFVQRVREYRSDSMAVRRSGDTVFVDRWHTMRQTIADRGTELHSIVTHDTVRVAIRDTVRVQEPKKEPGRGTVVKSKVLRCMGVLAVVLTLIGLVMFVKERVKYR